MKEKIDEYKESMKFFNRRYEEHEEWRTIVERKDVEYVKSLNALMDRMSACEDTAAKQRDGMNDFDRRWRSYHV